MVYRSPGRKTAGCASTCSGNASLLDPTEDAAIRASDCYAAYRLLTEVECLPISADMLVASAVAQQAVFKAKGTAADRQEYLQRLRTAIQEFPDDSNLWGSQFFLANELNNGTPDEKKRLSKCWTRACKRPCRVEGYNRAIEGLDPLDPP